MKELTVHWEIWWDVEFRPPPTICMIGTAHCRTQHVHFCSKSVFKYDNSVFRSVKCADLIRNSSEFNSTHFNLFFFTHFMCEGHFWMFDSSNLWWFIFFFFVPTECFGHWQCRLLQVAVFCLFINCVPERVNFMSTFAQAVQTGGKKEVKYVAPTFEGTVIWHTTGTAITNVWLASLLSMEPDWTDSSHRLRCSERPTLPWNASQTQHALTKCKDSHILSPSAAAFYHRFSLYMLMLSTLLELLLMMFLWVLF